MPGYNKVISMGNLASDVDLRYTAGGSPVANFRVAVNRKYKQNNEVKEEVCFVPIIVWGKQAESCSEYLAKGSPVLIEGRLQQNNWETDDGQKRSRLEVVAERVTFLSKTQQQSQSTEESDDIPF